MYDKCKKLLDKDIKVEQKRLSEVQNIKKGKNKNKKKAKTIENKIKIDKK